MRMTNLPEFETPPLVEVALGVQFAPVPLIRPVELAPLRERWRKRYPLVQEQPALPSQIESNEEGLPTFQVTIGGPQPRLWFISEKEEELVQLQNDRLIVNWRDTPDERTYPRFPAVRELFRERAAELETFIGERGGHPLAITQVEMIYINAIDPGEGVGRLERVLRNWKPIIGHHLGPPDEARAAVVFSVAGLGRPPVRMYVAADPSRRPDGHPAFFLTITLRGAPADSSLEGALEFIDQAHDHMVRSFAELTPTDMHKEWGRVQ
jgi:uncharacterized protein (TIGR04255 family)